MQAVQTVAEVEHAAQGEVQEGHVVPVSQYPGLQERQVVASVHVWQGLGQRRQFVATR